MISHLLDDLLLGPREAKVIATRISINSNHAAVEKFCQLTV